VEHQQLLAKQEVCARTSVDGVRQDWFRSEAYKTRMAVAELKRRLIPLARRLRTAED